MKLGLILVLSAVLLLALAVPALAAESDHATTSRRGTELTPAAEAARPTWSCPT